MKCFILFGVLCAAIGFSEQAITKEQATEMFKKMAEECAGKEGATAADIEQALAKQPPTTKGGKCMHACVGEKIGFFKDNKLSVEAHVAMAKMAYENDAARIQTVTDISNECAGITDGDRCEAVAKIIQCEENAAKARGFNLYDW